MGFVTKRIQFDMGPITLARLFLQGLIIPIRLNPREGLTKNIGVFHYRRGEGSGMPDFPLRKKKTKHGLKTLDFA